MFHVNMMRPTNSSKKHLAALPMSEVNDVSLIATAVHILCFHIRLHSAVQAKQKDKQTISQLEKRLKAEQDARTVAEKQLAEERKRKKMEEATAARAVALAAATRFALLVY